MFNVEDMKNSGMYMKIFFNLNIDNIIGISLYCDFLTYNFSDLQ